MAKRSPEPQASTSTLTLDEARRTAATALRQSGARAVLLPSHVERPFGWVFFATTAESAASVDPAQSPILLVNRYSRQVLLTSMAFLVQRCVDGYETLLKAQGRDWCLTLGAPRLPSSKRSVERELQKMGLSDITPRP